MVENKKHSHELLHGHISSNDFDVAIREDWRTNRYWEALQCHHTYSNDRLALLSTIHNLFQCLGELTGFTPTSGNRYMSILDIGCGTGEVSSAMLAKLNRWTCLEYVGIDKNSQALEEARLRLKEIVKPEVRSVLRQKDYNEKEWSSENIFKARCFDVLWMIHSGYYVDQDHVVFLKSIEQFISSHGIMLLIHNPAGNAPFLAAAKQIGLEAYRVQYERQICPPKVPAEILTALGSEAPCSLDKFCHLFSEYPEARVLRLMLEFYLPEYPLEFLLPHDRYLYIENWKDHLLKNDWKFVNDHEMLVLLPRHHAISFRDNLDIILKKVIFPVLDI